LKVKTWQFPSLGTLVTDNSLTYLYAAYTVHFHILIYWL